MRRICSGLAPGSPGPTPGWPAPGCKAPTWAPPGGASSSSSPSRSAAAWFGGGSEITRCYVQAILKFFRFTCSSVLTVFVTFVYFFNA